MKKQFFLCAIFSVLLVSCGTETIATSTDSTSSSAEEVTSEEVTSVEESFEEVSVTPVSRDSTGGVLTDINMGMNMFAGKSDIFTISGDDIQQDNLDVSFSNPELVSYEYVGTSHTLNFLKAGNTSIIIKDSNGLISYRNVIHVRDVKTVEELEEYIVSVDFYNTKFTISNTTDIQIIFEPGNKAILNGEDYGSVMDGTTFEYSFVKERPDYSSYEFSVSNFTLPEGNSSTLNLQTLMINYDGSNMLAYDTNLAAVMGPVVDNVNQYYMN